MGSVIENGKTKAKCQIFTPDNVVNEMLDYLGYQKNIYGKLILENSCGNGRFLKEIVKRYIFDCKNNGITQATIKKGLSTDIYGIELDKTHYEVCLAELNKVAESFGINGVQWSIFNRDALRKPIDKEFDYIVGNPPYVSYWDMHKSEREYIKKNFSACSSGACDYSYAFIQDALSRLAAQGKMVYIIPNSIFKTRSGKELRSLLLPDIKVIYDYTITKLFEGVLTTPAIIVIDRENRAKELNYYDIPRKKHVALKKTDLEDIWVFADTSLVSAPRTYRFGDYFNAAIGVATQRNMAFVLSSWTEQGKYIRKGETKIEIQAVRKAASPRGKKKEIQEYILFPYFYKDGVIAHYSEAKYKKEFPRAYKYISAHKEDLEKRDADEKSQWFEYGRSQALNHINTEKLLISTVITGAINIYELNEDEVPYSGLYITVKQVDNPLSLNEAKEILRSESFFRYIQSVGVNASGKSVRITAKNICDYRW